jgi:hypothetical protein
MTDQQLISDLTTARDLLAKPNGFLHNRVWDKDNGFCSAGAVVYAITGLRLCVLGERYHAAMDALAQHTPYDFRVFRDAERKIHAQTNVVQFNDTHTQEEVVELFDKTLADLGGLG